MSVSKSTDAPILLAAASRMKVPVESQKIDGNRLVVDSTWFEILQSPTEKHGCSRLIFGTGQMRIGEINDTATDFLRAMRAVHSVQLAAALSV